MACLQWTFWKVGGKMGFNTLQYAKKLEAVGIPRNHAEAHIQIIAEIVEGDLATKQDLKNTEISLRQDIKDTRDDLIKLEYRLIIKLGVVVVTTTTLAMALATWIMRLH